MMEDDDDEKKMTTEDDEDAKMTKMEDDEDEDFPPRSKYSKDDTGKTARMDADLHEDCKTM